VAQGYWGSPQETAERFRPAPAWLEAGAGTPAVWSGDHCSLDEEGYCRFHGRADAMIKTSGYRVSPTEVEATAHELASVAASAAVGIPHAELGQAIALAVVAQTGSTVDSEALLQHLRTRLPRFMVPTQVVVLDALPQTPHGKTDYPAVRALLA
jgi:acyl-coenzyme A synthetase/AMP-(fatty) acid ligase